VFHARTKHTEVHYHFIREKVLASEIDFIYVSIEDQVTDIFTKVLGAEKHRRFHNMLGVMELELSLRGSVELELTLMMYLSDRSTSTGALSDHSTFTSTDARVTDLGHCFFLEDLLSSRGVCVCKSSSSFPPYLFIKRAQEAYNNTTILT